MRKTHHHPQDLSFAGADPRVLDCVRFPRPRTTALISYITQIHLHDGAIAVLRDERARVGIRRPLFVTDPGIVRAGLLDRVLAAAGAADGTVYADTPGNPNEQAVRQAAALYRERGCDGVIAVGGGSSIDLAKGVAVCATHEGPLRQFAAIEGGVERITAATAPVIAVPT
ncbi:MAG: iron-containing alcohol dehydrogenase, partial [Comamonadaceae bacterium]